MQKHHKGLFRDKRGASPAISTVILTAAGIVMILIAMSYANNILSMKVAQNEYSTNKQFMQTTGQQIDDVAWTIGRSQTVTYTCKYGAVKFQDAVLEYTYQVHTSSGWKNITLSGKTGIITYNMPVSSYSMGNNYFERLPQNANSSYILSGASSPISQVICEEKIPMSDGSYNRIALIPTMRMLTSTVASTNYYKFYLPDLENSTNLYKSQSITLTGNGITKTVQSGVDQVKISVNYLKAANPGFDSSFFNFKSTTVTLNSTSTPQIAPNSVVEFYIGKVIVSIGQA